jgi:hypothetical protein
MTGQSTNQISQDQLARLQGLLTDIQRMVLQVEANGVVIRERIARSNELLALVKQEETTLVDITIEPVQAAELA